LEVGLNTIPAGEYLVELVLGGVTGDGATTLIPFRVGS
jgi:Flp pilus assembly CpaF family ATPase